MTSLVVATRAILPSLVGVAFLLVGVVELLTLVGGVR
jgi:hypothetical protein